MYLGNTPTVVASAVMGKIVAYRPGMFKREGRKTMPPLDHAQLLAA